MFNTAFSTALAVAKSPVTHTVLKSMGKGLALTSGISFAGGVLNNRLSGWLTIDASYKANLNKSLPLMIRRSTMSMEMDSWLRANDLTEDFEITSWMRIKSDIEAGLFNTVTQLPENLVMNGVNQIPFANLWARSGAVFGSGLLSRYATNAWVTRRQETRTRKYLAEFGTTLTQVLGEYRHGQATPRKFTKVRFAARQSA